MTKLRTLALTALFLGFFFAQICSAEEKKSLSVTEAAKKVPENSVFFLHVPNASASLKKMDQLWTHQFVTDPELQEFRNFFSALFMKGIQEEEGENPGGLESLIWCKKALSNPGDHGSIAIYPDGLDEQGRAKFAILCSGKMYIDQEYIDLYKKFCDKVQANPEKTRLQLQAMEKMHLLYVMEGNDVALLKAFTRLGCDFGAKILGRTVEDCTVENLSGFKSTSPQAGIVTYHLFSGNTAYITTDLEMLKSYLKGAPEKSLADREDFKLGLKKCGEGELFCHLDTQALLRVLKTKAEKDDTSTEKKILPYLEGLGLFQAQSYTWTLHFEKEAIRIRAFLGLDTSKPCLFSTFWPGDPKPFTLLHAAPTDPMGLIALTLDKKATVELFRNLGKKEGEQPPAPNEFDDMLTASNISQENLLDAFGDEALLSVRQGLPMPECVLLAPVKNQKTLQTALDIGLDLINRDNPVKCLKTEVDGYPCYTIKEFLPITCILTPDHILIGNSALEIRAAIGRLKDKNGFPSGAVYKTLAPQLETNPRGFLYVDSKKVTSSCSLLLPAIWQEMEKDAARQNISCDLTAMPDAETLATHLPQTANTLHLDKEGLYLDAEIGLDIYTALLSIAPDFLLIYTVQDLMDAIEKNKNKMQDEEELHPKKEPLKDADGKTIPEI